MLLELHNTIRQLIYQFGNIDSREVDITFEAPIQERIDKLIHPAINIFLFDLQENTELRQGDLERMANNGRWERRPPLRRFDLCYMVSALTTEVEDEHELIWRTLLTLLRHPQFPPELLPEELRALEPTPTTKVSQADEGQRLSAIWTALGVPPRPALYYVVTVPVDMNMVIEAPLVLTRTARYTQAHVDSLSSEVGIQIGGTVRNQEGLPLTNVNVALEGRAIPGSQTNEEGRFVLAGVPSGKVELRVTSADGKHKIVKLEIPEPRREGVLKIEQSYDIVLEVAAT